MQKQRVKVVSKGECTQQRRPVPALVLVRALEKGVAGRSLMLPGRRRGDSFVLSISLELADQVMQPSEITFTTVVSKT